MHLIALRAIVHCMCVCTYELRVTSRNRETEKIALKVNVVDDSPNGVYGSSSYVFVNLVFPIKMGLFLRIVIHFMIS